MKNKLINLLLLTLLFIGQGAYATEPLSAKKFDPQAKAKADSLYNQAHRAYSNGHYREAIELYKESYEYKAASDVAINLGVAYEKNEDYNNAIKWYKEAYNLGDIGGGNNLGLLYKKNKETKNAIAWYKNAIKKGHINARKNLGLLYHEQKNNLNSATYMIAMIGHPYTKERVLGLLRDDWKIDEVTLKNAYELQKALVPNPYTGAID